VPTEGTGIAEDARFVIEAIQRLNPGVSMVIVRRAGAGGTIGTAQVARAKPDGYTLLTSSASFVLTGLVYPNLSYDVRKDFSPITMLNEKGYFLEANIEAPFNNIKDYIAYAKANPGMLNFATSGFGSTTHIPGVLLDYMAGTKVTYVNYKRSVDRYTDTLAGRTHVVIGGYNNLQAHLQTGKIKPLAYTGTQRHPFAPDVPTIGEVVPGYEYTTWTGTLGPAKIPSALLRKINRMWIDGLRDPVTTKKMTAEGETIGANSSADFQKFINVEAAKWDKVIKATGLTIEAN